MIRVVMMTLGRRDDSSFFDVFDFLAYLKHTRQTVDVDNTITKEPLEYANWFSVFTQV